MTGELSNRGTEQQNTKTTEQQNNRTTRSVGVELVMRDVCAREEEEPTAP